MRVALVSGYDWAVPGGAQGQVAALARALVAMGETVAVVSPQKTAGSGPPVPGAQFFRAGRGIPIPVNGSVAPVAPTPAAALATVRALRAFAPDVVHVHEPLVPGPPLAAMLAGPRPIVATFHRADADALYRAEGMLLGSAVGKRCAVATGVSAAAIETARTVLRRHTPRLLEVGNGVEVDRFERARLAREALRAPSGTFKGGAAPVVAFVGRHERRKGASVLLDAFALVGIGDQFADARLIVAGDGPESSDLRRRAAGDPRIFFPGRIDDDEVAALVASADVLVAPAIAGESFGMVLLEAMAAGTAVIASDIPGYSLAASGAARLFAAGDPRDLASALGKVLADEVGRKALVERGLARARACSIDVIAQRYRQVYGSVALESGPRPEA